MKGNTMKIYIVEHSCNTAGKMEHFHGIVDAFMEQKDAQEKLFEICEAVAKKEYPLFHDMEVKRVHPLSGDTLTYEWKDNEDEINYTHFKIVETELH